MYHTTEQTAYKPGICFSLYSKSSSCLQKLSFSKRQKLGMLLLFVTQYLHPSPTRSSYQDIQGMEILQHSINHHLHLILTFVISIAIHLFGFRCTNSRSKLTTGTFMLPNRISFQSLMKPVNLSWTVLPTISNKAILLQMSYFQITFLRNMQVSVQHYTNQKECYSSHT